MKKIFSFHWFSSIALVVIVIFIAFSAATSHVLADCGTPPKSSCSICHSPNGHGQVMGDWNSIHLNQDICLNCHGGNGNSMDKDLAHDGVIRQPLNDVYTDCHSCHPSDYLARSAQIAASLNVTPDSCATPTAIAVYAGSNSSHTGNLAKALDNQGATTAWKSFVVIPFTLAGLIFFLFGIGWLNGHHVKG